MIHILCTKTSSTNNGAGHVEVVEALLPAGTSAHLRNAKRWAAGHSAAAAGRLPLLRLFNAAPRSGRHLDALRLLTSNNAAVQELKGELQEKVLPLSIKSDQH